MTFYIDIILAENMCMNYIILYATGMIYKLKPRKTRMIISSLIGAVYAILSYMQVLEVYTSFLLKVFLSIAMVYLAFIPKNFSSLLKQLIIFYLTSFVFGGVAFFLLYFIKPQEILMQNGIYIGTYPLKIVFLGAVIGFALLNVVLKFIKGKISKKDLFCKLKINIESNWKDVIAMIDTGNMLKEPITGANVIVVEKCELEKIVPLEILKNLDEILKGEFKKNLGEYASKIRLIPFSSIGKQNGMLLGIKPDRILIETEDDMVQIPDAVLGIYNGYLTKDGQYTALVGLDVLERRNINEFIKYAERQH